MEILYSRIRELRERLGFSQETLAKKVGYLNTIKLRHMRHMLTYATRFSTVSALDRSNP